MSNFLLSIHVGAETITKRYRSKSSPFWLGQVMSVVPKQPEIAPDVLESLLKRDSVMRLPDLVEKHRGTKWGYPYSEGVKGMLRRHHMEPGGCKGFAEKVLIVDPVDAEALKILEEAGYQHEYEGCWYLDERLSNSEFLVQDMAVQLGCSIFNLGPKPPFKFSPTSPDHCDHEYVSDSCERGGAAYNIVPGQRGDFLPVLVKTRLECQPDLEPSKPFRKTRGKVRDAINRKDVLPVLREHAALTEQEGRVEEGQLGLWLAWEAMVNIEADDMSRMQNLYNLFKQREAKTASYSYSLEIERRLRRTR